MEGFAERFEEYVSKLVEAIGHADREKPLRGYLNGLLLPLERKSVEPMAAAVEPERVSAARQSMSHLVGQAPWSDAALMEAVQEQVLPLMLRHGPIESWLVDDSGVPKSGSHSVGVERQYCGQLGKKANCQVAVTLSLANRAASLPVACRLYLPDSWAEDKGRRERAGIPEEVVFQTKPQIALAQIAQALADGLPAGVVLADAAYGNDSAFREGVTALGLSYAVGIQGSTTLWREGQGPLPPAPYRGRGQRPKNCRRTPEHQPVAVEDLARELPPERWQAVCWREGTNHRLCSRFAALRVRPAHRDHLRTEPWPEEWLLIEWPEGEKEPTHYGLSTLPSDTPLPALVARFKGRWPVEYDYENLKQEVGFGQYEGRFWRGFHHHASLCIAAYGFLIAERCAFPPSRPDTRRLGRQPLLPDGYRPRGAAPAPRAPHPTLHRHPPSAH